jgi:hypothetical protein
MLAARRARAALERKPLDWDDPRLGEVAEWLKALAC